MTIIDTHCHLDHLDLTEYNGDLSKAIDFAHKQGVKRMICVAIDLDSIPDMLAMVSQYQHIAATVGLHPNETVDQEPTVDQLVTLAKHPKVVAIGETGLDYYRSDGDLDWQRQRFRTHIQAAKQARLPLVVHTRAAKQDTIRIMREENAKDVGGVLHCFTEDWEMAKQGIDLGFMISFSGIVTFKNSKELQAVAEKVPLESMLIETDSPYLAPVPKRGKPNQPGYVAYVAEFLAELKKIELSVFCEKTTENAIKVFGDF